MLRNAKTLTWRILYTLAAWLLGLSLTIDDPTTFWSMLIVIAALLLGSLPWIPLVGGKRGTLCRVVATLMILVSVLHIVLVAWQLPDLYKSRKLEDTRTIQNQEGT
jgi:hypothetical protein